MSPDVAKFLLDMLLRGQISVSDPNLVGMATLAAKAIQELNEEISRATLEPTETRG